MSHVVPVYSIGKPYTAAAAALSFALDATLGELLPELARGPVPGLARLNLRSVLQHRSGLNDYGGWLDYADAVARRGESWAVSDVLSRAEVGRPGEFRYSNIGYLLVRLALEREHGALFFDVLHGLVLEPLGVRAWPFAEPSDWERCTHPAIDNDLRAYDPGWVYTGTFAAAPDNVASGLAALLAGGLGGPLAHDMLTMLPVNAPPEHPFTPHAAYGLGLMGHGSPLRVVGHGGGGPGFTLFAAVAPDGSRSFGDCEPAGGDENALVRRCMRAVLT
ncbi:serine hydrolase [Micrococcales bacterium 31B]|nr:serine hydrolase [Micrococcales bacterium 31B]